MEEDIKVLEDMRNNIYGAIQFEDDYEVRALEQKQFDALNLAINHLRKIKLVHSQFIPKSALQKVLGLEEDMTEEKILNYIDILVSENNRLEDIEDRKVQIEYNNVFNKGVKSVEKKIQEKIEELEKIIQKEEEETCGRCITIGKWETIKYLQELLQEGNK